MDDNIQKYRVLRGLLPLASERKLVLLTGARQTGKTTLVKEQYAGLRYINLDAPEEREILRQVSSHFWGRDVGVAVIDEAQKEPIVFEKIKFAFDAKDIQFCVLLGSSQILLLKRIRESLAGRVQIFEIWPLLFSELCQSPLKVAFQEPLIQKLIAGGAVSKVLADVPSVVLSNDDARLKDHEQYLYTWGGMPALLPLEPAQRWKWLKDYEYTYLERDLSDLARLDDLEPFKKFQRLSAARSARLLNYSEIARDTGISVDTAKRYLEYLRLSYQVILLQPFAENITSSAVKTPKLYWVDVGMLRQLRGEHESLSGEIYENMVVAELVKWIKTTQQDINVYFYRTRSGLEVDILLKTARGLLGMEIKATQRLSGKDTTAMRQVAAGLGAKWLGGIIVYQGNELIKLASPDIWAVPFRRLFS